eukprot:2488544-Rhodomonas_salina.1
MQVQASGGFRGPPPLFAPTPQSTADSSHASCVDRGGGRQCVACGKEERKGRGERKRGEKRRKEERAGEGKRASQPDRQRERDRETARETGRERDRERERQRERPGRATGGGCG